MNMENIYERYLKHIVRLKTSLQSIGSDHQANIRELLSLCGDFVSADFVLYNVQQGAKIETKESWQAPDELLHNDDNNYDVCKRVIRQQETGIIFIPDLQAVDAGLTNTCVRDHGAISYLGHPVVWDGKSRGVICAFYRRMFTPNDESIAMMELIANLVGAEEDRTLQQSLREEGESSFRQLYQMLRLMCDNSPDMIWAKDTKNCYLFTNLAFCNKILQAKNTDEPVGKNDMFFAERERAAHPENPEWHTFGEICRDSDTEVIETLCPMKFDEYGNVRGKFIRLDVRKAPFFDENGNLIGTVGSARDVTNSKEIEEALLESQERYQALLDANPDLMFIYSEEGVYLDYRVRDKSTMVSDPASMLGKSVYDMLPVDLADEAMAAIQYVKKTGQMYVHEYELHLGKSQFFESRFVPCGANKYLCIIRDITRRKQADIKLREAEEKYRLIYETANEGIMAMNAEHVITDVNKKFCEMLGYNQDEIVGHDPGFFIYEDDLHDILARQKRRMSGHHDVYERRFKKRDGSTLWTLVSASSNMSASGEYLGSFLMFQDITSRKAIELSMMNSIARYALQRNCMTNISVSDCIKDGDIEGIAMEISVMSAKTMEVERVSVWLFDGIDQNLHCVEMYESTPNRHSSGQILKVAEYESEFAFLRNAKYMDSDDPYTDPRTAGYVETYLKPNRITAMLDVVIRSSGRDYGVICFEHVGSPHRWKEDEISFACQLADQLALTLGNVDRRKAENALKLSEERYRLLLDMAPVGIAVHSQGKVVFTNAAGAKIVGENSPDSMIGKPISAYVHERSITDAFENLGRLQAGEPVQYPAVYYFRRIDGSPVPVEVTATLMNYDGQQAAQIIFTDISERVKAEENVQRNVERLTSITNILQYRTDSAQEFLDYALSEAVRLTDSSIGFILNSTPDEENYHHMASVFRQGIKKTDTGAYKLRISESGVWAQTINTGKPLIINDYESLPTKSMPRVWHDPIKNLISIPIIHNSQIAALIGLANKPEDYDDTDLLQVMLLMDSVWKMLENRKSSEMIRKLSRAVQQSPVSIVITDTNGNIEYVNDFFCQLSGYSFHEAVGANPRISKSGFTSLSTYQQLWERISSGKIWNGELLNRKANGELYWENVSITPVIDDEGKIVNYVGVKEDITARKLMTEELIQAKDQAEQMNRLKSSFLANMSHELRTPLVGIMGYSELLANMVTDGDQKDMVRTIHKSGKRLLNTLNLILDLSRIESNKQDIRQITFELNEFVRDRVNLFKAAAVKKDLALNMVTSDTPLYLYSDPRLLEHVVNDLINNAIKFTNQGLVEVSVGIGCRDNPNAAVIAVRDTGIGIPENRLDVIFEGFRQVSEGYDRNYDGTGLGLTISQKYTELLGGRIEVESRVNEGSTFRVIFPEGLICETDQDVPSFTQDEPVEQAQLQLPPPQGYKILLVDDDPVSHDLIAKFLIPLFEVHHAENSEVALRLARENRYDAVMLDISLKDGLNGMKLVQALRDIESYSTTPILAVTAYSMVGDKERFLAGGCSHYLSKPFSQEDLLSVLASMFDA